ncbi:MULTISPECIES: chloramphenicol phosphotransferase CPT [Catenuloplanes]|uniref:Chloramphenicol 3-O phosphotransferase n=1 Tax=Catenuloplanes niger TaxID=587534 RepID=A0AAE3ZTF9_9ACTN|nr:chloramphenicol phosphotransferase CPT [Catenuloplanes niger]MDR7323580.1 chloramphenicol 3-O phosphotransferase [Catenuloplanes niger]
MRTQVIVLNGGSSAGKSGIVRCLQAILPDPWLATGVDRLIEAMPATMRSPESIDFAADGTVVIGPEFDRLQNAWMAGVAGTAAAGAKIIIDDVFLSGARSQQRWRAVLNGLDVVWAGVRCDAQVAAGREIARGDRVRGMAAAQADMVHQGVVYDVEVDTTHTESIVCAERIAERL